MMEGLKIIKIIKKGEAIYKFGEVLEVIPSLADRLVSKDIAVYSNPEELLSYERGQLGKRLSKKAEIDRENRLKKIKLDNYIENTQEFYSFQPFFYDKQETFWFWNNELHKWEIVDDIDIMNRLDYILGLEGQTVSHGIKKNYLEAFMRVGRMKQPRPAPAKWIQFKDKAFSLNSGKIYDVKPNYFFTNPIPYELSDSIDTPTMDKLCAEWVGVQYMDLLYEIIAYSCYTGYPIQLLFSLIGNGRNGKSCFIRLLSKFIGKDNLCATELDLLTGHGSSRFESFKLYKKLVCIMGETNFGTLNKSSLIKKLTGGDLIGFEMKNKKPFDDYNYAKMIIASNSLPTSEDTSEGFYRRWLIVDFPNEFPEGKDILKSIPEEEYNNLATKVCLILPKLLERGEFLNQGSIEERKERFIISSNPITIFIKENCIVDEGAYVSYGKLYTEYVKFLFKNKKRRVKSKEFKSALENEGFYTEKTSKKIVCNDGDEWKGGYWVIGLDLRLL